MALYTVNLRQATDAPGIPARKWSNVFYVEAASAVAAASALVAAWVGNLRDAATERVFAYEAYATDQNPTTTDFVTVAVPQASQRGTIGITGLGEPYLPKACVAVELLVPGSRPMRKFWRSGLYDGQVTNGITISSTLETAIRTAFVELVEGFSGLRDPDGQVLSSVGTLRLTTREFGREATNLVPAGPPLS